LTPFVDDKKGERYFDRVIYGELAFVIFWEYLFSVFGVGYVFCVLLTFALCVYVYLVFEVGMNL